MPQRCATLTRSKTSSDALHPAVDWPNAFPFFRFYVRSQKLLTALYSVRFSTSSKTDYSVASQRLRIFLALSIQRLASNKTNSTRQNFKCVFEME